MTSRGFRGGTFVTTLTCDFGADREVKHGDHSHVQSASGKRSVDRNELCSDENRVERGLAILQQHLHDFMQIGIQLVERLTL